ncbi:DUF6438 domain-containing protein [Roseivirga sp. BDSF3-8]|uniref:DUF6438 domain-containing protein n=1 Tax=Roseivirga sp. BDSF3-8 TaxID=3241598 RepID=UPI003531D5E4
MKVIPLALLIISLLISCSGNKKPEKVSIVGTWSVVEYPGESFYIPMEYSGPFGLTISEDSIEFLSGFTNSKKNPTTGKHQFYYLNNVFPYKIEADSILIADSLAGPWRIEKLHSDTLILTDKNANLIKLQRIQFKQHENFGYDQIIFSRSGCFGPCPNYDISIKSTNEVLYRGSNFVSKIGIYKANLDHKQTRTIFSKFNRVDITQLSGDYVADHTDDEAVSTTFLKNGEIVKTISDYGRVGPKELVWTYVSMEYLLDSLIAERTIESWFPTITFYSFSNDSVKLQLEQSESFLLWGELRQSTITDTDFPSDYEVNFGQSTKVKDDMIQQIESDGQYFRIQVQGKQPITYDLGYNFVKRHFDRSDFEE